MSRSRPPRRDRGSAGSARRDQGKSGLPLPRANSRVGWLVGRMYLPHMEEIQHVLDPGLPSGANSRAGARGGQDGSVDCIVAQKRMHDWPQCRRTQCCLCRRYSLCYRSIDVVASAALPCRHERRVLGRWDHPPLTDRRAGTMHGVAGLGSVGPTEVSRSAAKPGVSVSRALVRWQPPGLRSRRRRRQRGPRQRRLGLRIVLTHSRRGSEGRSY